MFEREQNAKNRNAGMRLLGLIMVLLALYYALAKALKNDDGNLLRFLRQ